ncbi:MAG: threonine--tRNA ligase, partial [Firmicutes bacterium]|nr:threonine--tRNA ligase [Bacillota bacterium]
MMRITVEGKPLDLPEGSTAQDIPGCPKNAVAVRVGREVWDLTRPLEDQSEVTWLTFDDEEGRHVFRHSSAHLLAQAIKRLWPQARLGTGPALEDGFYYDVQLPEQISEADLPRIEETMRQIVKENLPIVRQELPRAKADQLFADRHESFKQEIIAGIPAEQTISTYQQGEFVDLCTGPHLPRTGMIGAVKLTNLSGAYWRGDEKNPVMTRIYGTTFPDEAELAAHLARLEEIKQRDHRKLGPQLDLFTFHEEAPGFAFWHAKGQQMYRTLEEFSRRLQDAQGYQEVATPSIFRVELWKKSGHWDHYRDDMFLTGREDEVLGVKPMNCPAHCLMFNEQVRSYRDLPIRMAEYGPLARYERSGALHGLMRVRGFHQDDAHIFAREDQVQEEIFKVLDLVDVFYKAFGLPYEVVLSTRPEDYMGELELWNLAEASLEQVLKDRELNYKINAKDGAFYGPKLDINAIDSLGRKWQ